VYGAIQFAKHYLYRAFNEKCVRIQAGEGLFGMEDTNFVVYMYVREDGTPYYIGKGRPERPYRNGGRPCGTPPKERITIYKQNIDERTAFELEEKLILKYGRKDLGTGILLNRSNGGEGSSGTIVSNETRRKMSESHRGSKSYNYTPKDWYHPKVGEVFQKSSGELSEMFPEMFLNIRCLDSVYRGEKTNHKGWKKLENKNKQHRRKNHISRNWWHIDHGEIYNLSVTELVNKFSDQNLSVSALSGVSNKKNLSHKGWKLLESKGKKRKSYKPVDWYHPEHGIFLQKNTRELISIFPDQNLNGSSLNKLSLGEISQHKGWSIYNKEGGNPKFVSKYPKYKPIDWFHSICGEVRGKSISELSKMFPEQKLNISSLSQLSNKKLIQYKGWRILKNPVISDGIAI
jgi:hypothetical protein